MSEDAYIVHIYRRAWNTAPDRRQPDRLDIVGTIENPVDGGRHSFHDIESLWAVLAKSPPNDNTHGGDQP